MLPELTSQHIACNIKWCFITILHNIIHDYAKELCLNICLNINLHKPDRCTWNINCAGLCQQNCKSFHIVLNQMQVRILGRPGVWSREEENKLFPNSEIQETDQLVPLRFGSWRFTCANCRKVFAPFGSQNSLWTKVFYNSETPEIM